MIDEPKTLDYLFSVVCRQHFKEANRLLESIGMHRGQPSLLGALGRQDGRTHSELAKILKVTPSTISNMIKRMEKTGLVIRRREDNDERVSRVYLTGKGFETIDTMLTVMQKLEGIAFAGFSEDEKAAMRVLLTKMSENLQDNINKDPEPL